MVYEGSADSIARSVLLHAGGGEVGVYQRGPLAGSVFGELIERVLARRATLDMIFRHGAFNRVQLFRQQRLEDVEFGARRHITSLSLKQRSNAALQTNYFFGNHFLHFAARNKH